MNQIVNDSQHLASLSGIVLSEEENKIVGGEIEKIIESITILDELDVSGVEPTYQTTRHKNAWREDDIKEGSVNRKDLLALAPESQDGQIKVPQVL